MTRQPSCHADASMKRRAVPVPAFPFGNELALGMGIADGIRDWRSQMGAFPGPLPFL